MSHLLAVFVCLPLMGCVDEEKSESAECCNSWGCVGVGEEICIEVEPEGWMETLAGQEALSSNPYGGIGVCDASGTIEETRTCEPSFSILENGEIFGLFGCTATTESYDGATVKCSGESGD